LLQATRFFKSTMTTLFHGRAPNFSGAITGFGHRLVDRHWEKS
jgi:hypothetical protein